MIHVYFKGTSDTKPDVNFATAFVNTAPVNG